ncbi:outer-membrane lipoprotein carrier protein [Psychromonas marina]|uniref:Outer-membrane lipoprotein carrier protein n=1 Tax=Psychromonas marina TaxID=88364 RepID=A0ABQ6E0N3_9GAMM|nr:outer membrane lipoprotein chaperone LolA [Psychromonas marina]GLS91016.1 outer-membrane lipoprotein carrier protein [Psychromonas marina]
MKKALLLLPVSLCLLLFSFSAQAISSQATQLKDKLAVFEQMHAQFVQRVLSSEGKLLNESSGEMTISRPGKFHWQVETPEEELIVSDGKTIWYYSPFIEQVTLINFADAINDTPFALIAGADEKQWENYIVKQQGNKFTVTNPTQVQPTTFIFEFDNKNNINKFIVIEEQGQRSEFTLTHQAMPNDFSDALFDFQIPENVEVDDQR